MSGASGSVTGTVTIEGQPAARKIIGISYEPQEIDDGEGGTVEQHIVVGQTVSATDGTYTLNTPDFTDEIIVLALEDYGEVWRPNHGYSVGDRVRPSQTFWAANPSLRGYVYEVETAGTSDETEPNWWIPQGGSDTGLIGDAGARAVPVWWSVGHAPVLPESTVTVPTDIHWNKVKLLLDAEPDGGSSVIVDRSQYGKTITTHGDIALSSALGESTIYADGNGDYLSFNNGEDFNPQEALTFEGHVWVPDESRSDTVMLYSARQDSPAGGMNLGIKTDGTLIMYGWRESGGGYFETSNEASPPTLAPETLTHFAMCRNASGLWTLWLGGQLVGSVTEPSPVRLGAATVYIGRQGGGSSPRYLKAHLKHARYTDGECRYTAPFTPPTGPFPTQAP